MPPLLPLLAAATAATAPAPSADDRALFAAFKAVCSQVRSFDALDRQARRGGWEAVAPEAQPNLALLVNKGREAVLQEEPEASLVGSQYRKQVGSRTLWLVTSRYADKDGFWGNGCRVYHFEAAGPLDPAELTVLMGRPNTGTLPLPEGQTKYLWEPGWKSGHSVEVSYVPGNDPQSQKFGLKGLVLTAQAIGGS